jgi:hypothetical protein
MIDKIWNWLVPREGVEGDIKNQGYIIICDGNMAFLVPNDPGNGSGCTEDHLASTWGCPSRHSDVATSFCE